jgi:hypothetical protein
VLVSSCTRLLQCKQPRMLCAGRSKWQCTSEPACRLHVLNAIRLASNVAACRTCQHSILAAPLRTSQWCPTLFHCTNILPEVCLAALASLWVSPTICANWQCRTAGQPGTSCAGQGSLLVLVGLSSCTRLLQGKQPHML